MGRAKILIVEDDPLFGRALLEVFDGSGYKTRLVGSGAAALDAAAEESFDLVVQDIKLPDANGIDVLQQILARQPHCGSLVMTGYGTIEDAVKAMKLGAFDYLTKPFPMELLFLKIESFLHQKRVGQQPPAAQDAARSEIITKSPAMRAALETAEKVAATPVSVLLHGESGTGKDLVAKLMHGKSQRSDGPFVAVNCAAIPPTLIEGELFGVAKGAYTGADTGRAGHIEMAEGGTLFLDEIGELPLDLQGKLLRVLEEKGCMRVGGTAFRNIDFRLICATNRDLNDMVQGREFRADLFYRISVVPVKLPPLRERREDIPLLLAHFLDKFCPPPQQRPEFTGEAMEILCHYGYPGNVRELRNAIERISLLYQGAKVCVQHLPQEMQVPALMGSTFESFDLGRPLRDAVHDYEKRYIEKVVDYAGGRKTLAAQILGLSRKALWEKLKK